MSTEHCGTRYGALLHGLDLSRPSMEDTNPLAPKTSSRRRGWSAHTLGGLPLSTVLFVIAVVGAFTFALRLLPEGIRSSMKTPSEFSAEPATSIELAQSLTAALNAYDADAVVQLFGEEDSGPTVTADRYAWGKFEIRLWVQQQVQASIHIEAYDYRSIEVGAAWNADVYHQDWRQLEYPLRVTNTIWVHNGKIADFTSKPSNPSDAWHLGYLWRPGSVPERPSGP